MPRVFIPRIITEDNALGGSKIEKSLRFNGDDTYLSRTPSSASNRRTWTWSAWIKKSKNGSVQDLFSAYDGSAYNIIRIGSDDQLNFQSNSAAIKETNAVLRDTSSWYHIVVAIDTTSGTAADRVIIYINGTRQSLATDNSVSQNTDYAFNTTNAHTIGVYANGSSYNFDGYMAEINFVDGYQYDTSYFGFTDGQTGMWLPKRYEGTYGTNGFYLDFGNASSGDEYQRYTVPTASFTNDSDTLLLINNNESNGSTTFTDSSSNSYSISGTGSIAHSTAQSKFGSSSILFDGSDDSLSVGGNGTLYSEMTASSNKTYEAFMYLNADDYTYIMSISSNQRYLGFYMDAGNGKFGFNGNYPNPYSSVQGFVPALDIPTGRWFHVFCQRNADGTMSVGFDGKILVDSVAEGADVSASGTTGPLKIGSQHYYGSTHRYFYDGYMDEIRMSDTPRYTALGGAGTCGQDYSGNNNNFTPKNFSLGGVVKDTPTNNFCTFNSLDNDDNITLSEGNLKIQGVGSWDQIKGNIGVSSGKWYFEAEADAIGTTSGWFAGIHEFKAGANYVNTYWSQNIYTVADYGYVYSVWDNNKAATNTSEKSFTSDITAGDIVGFRVDLDRNEFSISVNGTDKGKVYDIQSGITYTPAVNFYGSGSKAILNCGQDSTFANAVTSGGYADANGIGDFKYPVPSGYKAICSANLPPKVPSIIRPQKHFDTLLWTGNNTVRTITGLEFKPDFVWVKCRTNGHDHQLTDSIRGVGKALRANETNAEDDWGSGGMGVFVNGGFVLNDTSNGRYNENSQTFVAWCWKGGGTAVSNSDGTITSQVSANQEAGFSVVSYTGNGTAGATVGHGLGKKPAWIILIRRDSADNRYVYHQFMNQGSNPEQHYSELNFHAGATDSNKIHNDTAPTTSVFSLSNDNASNGNTYPYIAYCWAEIPGYSKFGEYRATGIDTKGPYIHLGFRPAWVMIKSMSLSNSDWMIFDNKRNTSNPVNIHLAANQTHVDGSDNYEIVDFLADGFRVTGLSGSGINYNTSYPLLLYMAFAEQPTETPFNTFPNAR